MDLAEIPAAAATIVASTIAATIAFIGLIISKENKTSEFRQQWIDALRSELADLISSAISIQGSLSVKRAGVGGETWEATASHFAAINKATALVRLRLNPGEASSGKVLAVIEKFESAFSSRNPDPATLNALAKELVKESQSVLKNEWERVKQGELVFRIAKWGSLIVASTAATGACWLIVEAALLG